MKLLSEDSVLDYLRRSRRGPMKAKEIAKGLAVAPRSFGDFRAVLRGMVERGRLYRVKGQRFAVPEKVNLVAGRVAVTQKGDGFVTPTRVGKISSCPASPWSLRWTETRWSSAWRGTRAVAAPLAV